jgi:NRPS condensation-like uncharacterized protein
MADAAEIPSTVPFSVIDEAVHLLDVPTAPWSIQLEVRVQGQLDEERLRAAITVALDRHPMARVHKKASHLKVHLDTWIIASRARLDPLRVVDCPDEEAIAATRAELQAISVPLTESPPLRVVLARHPGGDLVMLNVNHAAMDGFGVMRVLQSIARAYSGAPDPLPTIDFVQSRNVTGRLEGAKLSIRIRRQLELAARLRDLVVPPARVADEGADDEGGYGFVHSCLSEAATAAVVRGASAAGGGASAAGGGGSAAGRGGWAAGGGGAKAKAAGNGRNKTATVNDVLLAALHLAIADWNEEHATPCRRIGVLVPANLRPPEWRNEIVGNFSLPARISTSRRDRRSPVRALKAVATKTRRKKQVGMGTAFIELLGQTSLLPLWAKKALVLALPLTGNRLVDTAMLSNLGRLDSLPSFGDGPGSGAVEELWFSPPARMPLGLTIGAATFERRLHLVLRYRHRLFDHRAAVRFSDLYLHKLQLLADAAGGDRNEAATRGPKPLQAA